MARNKSKVAVADATEPVPESAVAVSEAPVEEQAPPAPQPEPWEPYSTDGLLMQVALEQIDPSPSNPRKAFPEAALVELADSIRQHGLLQPLVVRQSGERFELVLGERRLRACKLVGLATAPAFARAMSDEQVLAAQLAENVARQDLSALEEAQAVARLHRQHNRSAQQISQAIGRSVRAVYNSLALVALTENNPAVLELVENGELPVSHAVLLASIPSAELQLAAAREVCGRDPETGDPDVGDPLSFRDAAQLVRSQYMTALTYAIWKLDDADLVPEAGACTTCPLAVHDEDEGKKASYCPDGGCWQKKRAAFLAVREAKAAKGVGKERIVKTGPQGTRLAYSGEYYDLADAKWSDTGTGGDGPKLKALLGKEKLAEMTVTVVVDEQGKTTELVKREDALKALAPDVPLAHEALKRPKSSSGSAAQAQENKRREAAIVIARAKIGAIAEAALEQDPAEVWLVLVRELIHGLHEGDRQVVKRRKLADAKAYPVSVLEAQIGNLTPAEARSLVVELALSERMLFSHLADGERKRLDTACVLYGLDPRAIASAAQQELRQKEKEKGKVTGKAKGGENGPSPEGEQASLPEPQAPAAETKPKAKRAGKKAR